MNWSQAVPLAWPDRWLASPEKISLLKSTPFRTLLGPRWPDPFRNAAEAAGIALIESATIPTAPLSRLEPHPGTAVIPAGSRWPQVRGINDGGQAAAGPTGSPWVDSNGWVVRIAQAKSPESPMWLAHTPPNGRALRAEDYQVAIADAQAWGAKWIVSLDDALISGLESGNEGAHATWNSIASAAAWFESNRPDPALRPVANLAVVSDFSSPLFNDALNLLSRRHVPYIAATPSQIDRLDLTKLRAILTSLEPLPEALERFAKNGGILIRTNAPPTPEGKPSVSPRWLWSGSSATAIKRPADPYELATDVHLLISRREDVVRLFNGSVFMASLLGDSQKWSVALVNYTGWKGGDDATIQVLKPFTRARMSGPDKEAADVAVIRRGPGIEVNLPKFCCYLRIEFS